MFCPWQRFETNSFQNSEMAYSKHAYHPRRARGICKFSFFFRKAVNLPLYKREIVGPENLCLRK